MKIKLHKQKGDFIWNTYGVSGKVDLTHICQNWNFALTSGLAILNKINSLDLILPVRNQDNAQYRIKPNFLYSK